MVRVIGLMSGTSVDGIDAALVEITGSTTDLQVEFVAAQTYPYPEQLRSQILAVCQGKQFSWAELAQLDDAIAFEFAQAALTLPTQHQPPQLIGSHGQTVYHRPPQATNLGYSVQFGRGAVIAQLTGIKTISNFRVADIAVGGQGAPLVPVVDAYLLSHPTENRCIQNLGGIGNVSYLPRTQDHLGSRINHSQMKILGWDTGPGNTLLDLAVQHFSGGSQTYDQEGSWAAGGTPNFSLVEKWLKQEFFQQLPPKSTGREQFGQAYLEQCLADAEVDGLTAEDLLATLTELSVASIEQSYRQFLPQMPDRVLLCGGGSRNLYLKHRLQTRLDTIPVSSTSDVGLNADFKEAIAFAVLAYWRLMEIPGNFAQVTGATRPVLLGEIHQPPDCLS